MCSIYLKSNAFYNVKLLFYSSINMSMNFSSVDSPPPA